jgi:glutathione S-transferase
VKEKVAMRLAFVEARLDGRKYLFGDQFTVADGYMFYAMRAWHRATNSELSTRMKEYYAHIVERPAVIAALQAEGIQ